jgi:hypothetical protein
MIREHLDNILTFCRHRISNGVSEGLNSKIMGLSINKNASDEELSEITPEDFDVT